EEDGTSPEEHAAYVRDLSWWSATELAAVTSDGHMHFLPARPGSLSLPAAAPPTFPPLSSLACLGDGRSALLCQPV
ncbi:unnamed protein product, partial [Chrysoparadoxa australica]